MDQIEFSVPERCDMMIAESSIERVCTAHGLHVAMKGSLDRRIWAQVHTRREAPWIKDLLPQVRAGIERALKGARDR